MGQEASCVAAWAGRRSEGVAHLEVDHLAFRGGFRVRMTFAELSSVEVRAGALTLTSSRGVLALDLGTAVAEAWAGRIRRPKPLLDKLGVKPGARVSVMGVRDERFLAELRARTDDVSARARVGADLIFYAADSQAALARLPRLGRSLQPAGAIWVVSPRGDRGIQDVHVIAAARAAGLVDTKVVRFSDTHTALKLVIPVDRR